MDFVQKVAGRFPDLKRPIPTNTSQSYILPVTSQTGVASSSLFSSGQSTQRPAMVAADNFSFSNISRDTVRKAMESERVKQTIAMGFDEDMVYELVKRKFSDEKKEYSSVLELVEDLQIEEEKAPSSFSDESQFSLYSCSTNSSENQRPESFASTSYSSSFKNEQSNILDSVGSDTSESVPSTSKDPVDLLQNMIDERTCKVCLDRVSNCVFQPCGHVCCCVSCSSALKKCPICRQTLHKVYKFYRWTLFLWNLLSNRIEIFYLSSNLLFVLFYLRCSVQLSGILIFLINMFIFIKKYL